MAVIFAAPAIHSQRVFDMQVGQVLLTLPSSFAATGMAVGILFQLVFATTALWTLFMLASLYQEFRKQRQAWRRDLHHGIIMVRV